MLKIATHSVNEFRQIQFFIHLPLGASTRKIQRFSRKTTTCVACMLYDSHLTRLVDKNIWQLVDYWNSRQWQVQHKWTVSCHMF